MEQPANVVGIICEFQKFLKMTYNVDVYDVALTKVKINSSLQRHGIYILLKALVNQSYLNIYLFSGSIVVRK